MSSNKKTNIAIFASGSGSNAEEIVKYFQDIPNIQVSLIVSNRKSAKVFQRADRLTINSVYIPKDSFQDESIVLAKLQAANIDAVVLAGFLLLIPSFLIKAYPNKIINIHPALLPKYGGKGMYGMNVHNAVFAAGETHSGITIHLVNEKYDDGKILAQFKTEIKGAKNSNDVAKMVLQLEHKHFPAVIHQYITETIQKTK